MTSGSAFIPLLETMVDFLDRPGRLLVPSGPAAELAERARALVRRIESADDRIVIGLVGGTGVGKSTLINALAGQEISVSTELRPTTSRLVVYRHRENPFSLSEDEQVHRHDSPALKQVTLADFPDFDSIEPQHRQALSRHFPKLDLLLWVADPVKYADLVFFDWLSLAPQAQVNSLFILNKVDEFQARYGNGAAGVIREVEADFRAKLHEYAGISDPEIMPLSALNASQGLNGPGQDGFLELTGRIQALSEVKRRISIKKMNLAFMTESLVSDFQMAADVPRVREAISRLDMGLDRGRQELESLVESESRRLGTILRKPWRDGLTAAARDHAPWPLGFFLYIWAGIKGLVGRGKTGGFDLSQLPPPDLNVLTGRLKALLDEAAFVLPSKGIETGPALEERFDRLPRPEKFSQAGGALLSQAAIKNSNQLARRFRWRIRHHLLPLLVVIYPYLPMIVAGIGGLFTDQVQPAAPSVHVTIGMKDLLPLLEIVLGLYLVETVYFAYRLDRAAGRAIDQLSKIWATGLLEGLKTDLLTPLEAIYRDLEQETARVEAIGEKVTEQGTGEK